MLKSDFDIVIKSTNVDFVLFDLCEELNKKLVLDSIVTKGITFKKNKSKDEIIDNGNFKMIEILMPRDY